MFQVPVIWSYLQFPKRMSSLHAPGLHVSQQLSKCGHQGNSISTSIPWELDRDRNSQVPPYTHWIRNLAWGFLWALQVISEAQWLLRTTGVYSLLWSALLLSALSHHPCQTPTHPLKDSWRKSLLDLWTYSLDHEYRAIHAHLYTHTVPWLDFHGCSMTLCYNDLFESLFFFKIFLMWTIFKVFIEFFIILLLFCFRREACGNLSSPTRDQTHNSCIGRWRLNHRTAREVPRKSFSPTQLNK